LDQDGQDELLSDLGGLTSDEILDNDVSIAMDTNVSNATGHTSSLSLGGRPKGISNEAKEITTEALIDAKNWCAVEYEKARRRRIAIDNKKRAKKGFAEALTIEASYKFYVPLYLLNRNTIKARTIKTKHLMCTHPDPLSPMQKVGAHVLKVILIRGAMRHPVSCAEGLALANSLITGTVSHMQLIKWKKKHLGKNYREETAAVLGHKYWNIFCKQNAREIESKKAVRYDSKCDDWCTLSNFERIYDDVYAMMMKCVVAKGLDEWVHQDREGNIVLEDDPKRDGRKTKH
jgi:hypothetical protein